MKTKQRKHWKICDILKINSFDIASRRFYYLFFLNETLQIRHFIKQSEI